VKITDSLRPPLAFPIQHVQIIAAMLTKLSVGGVMRNFLVLGLLILGFSSTSKTQLSSAAFHDKAEHFINYRKDFSTFETASKIDSPDYDTARVLSEIAGVAIERIRSARTLLEIYSELTCPEDRAKVRPLIEKEFHDYKMLLEHSIDRVNLCLSYTQKPAITSEAIRMRDELREVESMLTFNPRLD
jgi:hypothetical protein